MAGEEQQIRQQHSGEEGVKYGDVFEISGDMAGQVISPRDAAAMQSAENSAFGKTIKGGPASIMLSAAAKNVEAGLYPSGEVSSDQKPVKGNQTWHDTQPAHTQVESVLSERSTEGGTGITIGEALQASAQAVGDKFVDEDDAAAIQAAEMRATGTTAALGSGLGAQAQANASVNALMVDERDKTKLSEIIGEAVNTLSNDKRATKCDAEMVTAAELKGESGDASSGKVEQSSTPGGVADAVATAARINESQKRA